MQWSYTYEPTPHFGMIIEGNPRHVARSKVNQRSRHAARVLILPQLYSNDPLNSRQIQFYRFLYKLLGGGKIRWEYDGNIAIY